MKQAPAPRDCPPITKTALRPGDVLLSSGSDDWINRLFPKRYAGMDTNAAVWDELCELVGTCLPCEPVEYAAAVRRAAL